MTSNPVDTVKARFDGGTKWLKNNIGSELGPACFMGAMLFTITDCERLKMMSLCLQVIREQFPDRYCLDEYSSLSITEFNDHPDTTYQDIDLVLSKASVIWNETELLQ